MIESFDGEYKFLSNFVRVPIILDGEMYRSVEHAYQAAKTLNTDERVLIQSKLSSGDAKRVGRTVTVRYDWDTIKLDIMEDLVRQKFNQEPFRSKLLATGSQEIQEGNWWGDVFWGVCKGKGENHLGKIIMKIRSELNAQT